MVETNPKQPTPVHFEGKDAIGHVAEAQAEGLLSSTEVHGAEIPGHISAGADSLRETAIALLVLWLVLSKVHTPFISEIQILIVFSLSWCFWKAGRSAWLAWSRLERMHRVVEQERWEIQHHRKQERDELTELYRAKGFEGKLLEDAIEVMMADDERLLKVMVEEELCLNLNSHEHPLKQAIGAFIGTAIAAVLCIAVYAIFPTYGMWFGGAIALTAAAALSAFYEGNRMIPAICWNLGLGTLTSGTAFFLFEYITE